MRAMFDEGIHLAERAFIEQQVNAFARRLVFFFMLCFDAAPRAAAQP